MSSKFNKILLVKKTTKFERMQASGRALCPYVENSLIQVWQDACNTHLSIADYCYESLLKMGKNVVMKKDMEVKAEDIEDKDLMISLGGDGTYLRAAGFIQTPNLPMLGINTDPTRSTGYLCTNKIYKDLKERQLMKIFDALEKENFEYFYRQRINFQMEQQLTGEKINKLVLNEIFAAEIDTGKTSTYRLHADNKYLGKFKSSGVIISTGTGSTGWLFSARRITSSDVRLILSQFGNQDDQELVEEHFARALSDMSMFPCDEEKMYYFVREGYAKDTTGYNKHKEGFTSNIRYQSELIEGRVYIDGHYRRDIGLGDEFIVDSKPEYRLKCIKFLI